MQAVTLSGTVTAYAGNGRQFGYPTANFSTETALADGVYFGYANLAAFANHPALVFIGIPVTVGDTERRVEVHLLDIPDVDYYDVPLSVSVQHFHRSNRKFDSVAELLDEMKADEQAARAWFAKP